MQIKTIELERIWIKSHHIKNKKKRCDIIQLAKDYKLSGFMLPGKPGVICLEGLKENTQHSWKTIKSWLWQKIHIVSIEHETLPEEAEDEIPKFCRFKGFRELLFMEGAEEGKADVKMSMSLFIKYLDDNKSQYMKKELFGFD